MFVDRRKILIGSLGTGTTIDIPLKTNFFPVDNSELIEDKFVKDEIEKSINPIEDYKKVIFKPADNNWNIIDRYEIDLNFYTPVSIASGAPAHRGVGAEPGVYADLNFKYDDLFCRTTRFTNSFIRFSFYDKPNSGQNQLLSFVDIFTQVGEKQKNTFGFPLPISASPISFVVGDPVKQPNEIHEGYNYYWFKDLVDNSINKEYSLYGVLQFNNALNGRIYDLAPSKEFDPNDIKLSDLEGEEGILYLKVVFKNDNGIYKYRFEPNQYQSGVLNNGTPIPPGVNLNPGSGGIPTLTFWQITP